MPAENPPQPGSAEQPAPPIKLLLLEQPTGDILETIPTGADRSRHMNFAAEAALRMRARDVQNHGDSVDNIDGVLRDLRDAPPALMGDLWPGLLDALQDNTDVVQGEAEADIDAITDDLGHVQASCNIWELAALDAGKLAVEIVQMLENGKPKGVKAHALEIVRLINLARNQA